MTRSYLHLHLGLDAEGGRSGEESEAAETETTGVWLPREMKVYNLRKSGYRDNPCFLFFPSFAGFLLTEMSDTAGLRSRSITAGGTLHQHDQLEGGSTGVRRSPTESDTAQDVS